MRYRYDDDEAPQTLEAFGEQIKEELRQEYIQNENQKNFWNEFYAANPLLRANRHVVLAVWQENIDEFMNSTPGAAMDRLADLATQRVNWLDQTKAQREEAACYVGGPEGSLPNEERIEVPETMGSTIKARRDARRSSQRGFNLRRQPENKPTYGRTA